MKFNPYHQWLGLDPHVKNPHYFQLLGVSATVGDPQMYKTQVTAAAKAKLEMLKQVDAGDKSQLLDQLRERVARAHQVLVDEKLRAAYIVKLKTEASSAKNIAPAKTGSTRSKKSNSALGVAEVNAPQSASLQNDNPVRPVDMRKDADRMPPAASPPVPHPSSPASGTPAAPFVPSAMNQSANATPLIPMAVAIPQSETPQFSAPIVESSDAQEFANFANDGDVGLPIKLRPVRRKKKSLAKQLFMAGMMLLMVGSTIGGSYFIIDRLLPRKDQSADTTTKAVPASADGNNDDNATAALPDSTTTDNSLQATIDSVNESGMPEESFSEELFLDETGEPMSPKVEPEPALTPERSSASSKSMVSDPFGVKSKSDPGNGTSKESTAGSQPDEGKTLSRLEELEFRRRLQQIRSSLKRRDRESTSRQIQFLDQRVAEWTEKGRSALVPAQQRLVTHLDASKHAVDLLDGFWAHVIDSCNQISGGQEIRIDQQVVGFVEGTDDFVILRNAGSNIKYEYEVLPPGLAVVLAEQGAIRDIPTWRMQLAAFYCLHDDASNRYEDRMDELVSKSVADGHDDSLLRDFANTDVSNLVSVEQLSFPDASSLKELIADFKREKSYSDIGKLKPDEAIALARQLFEAVPDSVEQAIAFMDQARQLASQGGDAFLVEDAVIELAQLSDVQTDELYLDSLTEISKQKLDTSAARRLLETAIPFMKTEGVGGLKKRQLNQLYERLVKQAVEHDFLDAQRRLQQLNQ